LLSELQPQAPRPQAHLLGIYGLVPLLKTVARQDPITGAKATSLRKSYDGQIKEFGLLGRNKSVKIDRDEHDASKFRQSIGSGLRERPYDPNSEQRPFLSDEVWNKEHARTSINANDAFKAKLEMAMQIESGTVRNIEHWNKILGHDKPRPPAPIPQAAPIQPVQRVPNGVVRPAGVDKRQTRGKKRSYSDESFTGYGDGNYSDVEDAGAIDEYGDDEGAVRKKRRKVVSSMGGARALAD
jgi:hypothetical protein